MGRIPLTIVLALLLAVLVAAPAADAAKSGRTPPAPAPTPSPNPAPAMPAESSPPLAIPLWVDQRPTATLPAADAASPAGPRPALTERALLGFDLPLFAIPVPPGADETHLSAESVALPAPAASSPLLALRWIGSLVGLVAIGAVLSRARLVAPPAPLPSADAHKPTLVFAAADDPQALLVAAKQAVDQNRIDEAVLWFDQALRLAPDLSVAHFCRGVCLVGLERHEEAYASLKRAYDLDPAEGAHRLELARACGRTGRASEAMSVLGPLLAALPSLIHEVRDDPAFACLADHPRWLVMTGSL